MPLLVVDVGIGVDFPTTARPDLASPSMAEVGLDKSTISLCDKGPKLNFGAGPCLPDKVMGDGLAASARTDCGRSPVDAGTLNESDMFYLMVKKRFFLVNKKCKGDDPLPNEMNPVIWDYERRYFGNPRNLEQ